MDSLSFFTFCFIGQVSSNAFHDARFNSEQDGIRPLTHFLEQVLVVYQVANVLYVQ